MKTMDHIPLEQILDYTDGNLSEQDNKKIEQHFAVCELCAQEWDHYIGFLGSGVTRPLTQPEQESLKEVSARLLARISAFLGAKNMKAPQNPLEFLRRTYGLSKVLDIKKQRKLKHLQQPEAKIAYMASPVTPSNTFVSQAWIVGQQDDNARTIVHIEMHQISSQVARFLMEFKMDFVGYQVAVLYLPKEQRHTQKNHGIKFWEGCVDEDGLAEFEIPKDLLPDALQLGQLKVALQKR